MSLAESAGTDHRNVLRLTGEGDWQELVETCYECSGDRPLFAFVDAPPLLERLSPERLREARSSAASRHSNAEDIACIANRATQSDALVESFVDTSAQTLRVERETDGMERVDIGKSPTGSPGTSKVLASGNEPPHVDLV